MRLDSYERSVSFIKKNSNKFFLTYIWNIFLQNNIAVCVCVCMSSAIYSVYHVRGLQVF